MEKTFCSYVKLYIIFGHDFRAILKLSEIFGPAIRPCMI